MLWRKYHQCNSGIPLVGMCIVLSWKILLSTVSGQKPHWMILTQRSWVWLTWQFTQFTEQTLLIPRFSKSRHEGLIWYTEARRWSDSGSVVGNTVTREVIRETKSVLRVKGLWEPCHNQTMKTTFRMFRQFLLASIALRVALASDQLGHN